MKNIKVYKKQSNEFRFILEALRISGINKKAFVIDFIGIKIIKDRVEVT